VTGMLRVRVEVWPVSADINGLWLLSGSDAWRSGPVPADTDPHAAVEQLLARGGALDDARVIHSTSWRAEDDAVIVTYVAALACPDVHDHWPGSKPISLDLPGAAGPPLEHPAAGPPMPDYAHVLLHAVRHMAFLADTDGAAREALTPEWVTHLAAFTPALAGMYERSWS
jgi:hypothetical protein